MPVHDHPVAHLVALIEAARLEAERLGPVAGGAKARLERTLVEVRAIQAGDGRPDEGLRPDELTTGNDL